jgi:hypothetical protein
VTDEHGAVVRGKPKKPRKIPAPLRSQGTLLSRPGPEKTLLNMTASEIWHIQDALHEVTLKGKQFLYLVERLVTGWTVRGSNLGRSKKVFLLQNPPDLLWGPPSLLFREYQVLSQSKEVGM